MEKKRIEMIGLSVLLVLALASFANATLLINGDFENGETGWLKWGPNAFVVSDSGYYHDTASAVLYWTDSGWVQLISGVSEGESFDMSGEMINPSVDPLTLRRVAYIKLEFWDAADTTMYAAHEVGAITRATTTDTWYSFSATGLVAPAGTGLVKAVLVTADDGTGGPGGSGWAYYDNIVVIPEPATIALLGLGGMFLLRRRR